MIVAVDGNPVRRINNRLLYLPIFLAKSRVSSATISFAKYFFKYLCDFCIQSTGFHKKKERKRRCSLTPEQKIRHMILRIGGDRGAQINRSGRRLAGGEKDHPQIVRREEGHRVQVVGPLQAANRLEVIRPLTVEPIRQGLGGRDR